MSKVSNPFATPEALISGVLADLRNGRFVDASAHFAQEFKFTDHGIGLEFKERPRLAEFFAKVREFYPDSSLTANRTFASGDHVIFEWTYQATIIEPFFGSASRKIPISLKGASIVRLTKARSLIGPTTMTASPQGAQPWPRISRSGSNCEQAQNWSYEYVSAHRTEEFERHGTSNRGFFRNRGALCRSFSTAGV